MALNRSFQLNNGQSIPAIGFGTWQAAPNEVERAVEIALRAGYRHIDCAAVYRNENEVGRGIRKSGVKREELFITGKLWNTNHRSEDVEKGLDRSLADLGTEYVDLFLMHWPVAFKAGNKFFPLSPDGIFELDGVNFVDTWKAMEKLLTTGKTKAVGVSNFNIRRLEELLQHSNVVPAINQVEAHPYLQQPDLLKYCQQQGILLAAYSPLGNNQTGEPRTVDDAKVHEIAKRLNVDPGQLLASWGVQRGTVVLPKSVTASRIVSNFQDFILPDDAMVELNALERHKRFNFPARWGVDIYDEVGTEYAQKVAFESAKENLVKFTV